MKYILIALTLLPATLLPKKNAARKISTEVFDTQPSQVFHLQPVRAAAWSPTKGKMLREQHLFFPMVRDQAAAVFSLLLVFKRACK
jgi:hypothetical protein